MGPTRSGWKPAATLAVALLAIVLAGCGGNGGDSAGAPAPSESSESAPSKSAEEPSRGGEASIEDFGSEAAGAERSEVLSAFHGYLDAVAEKDYGAACSHLSADVRRSLEAIAPESVKAKGCEGILPEVAAPNASQGALQQSSGEVTKVRVEGDQGFVVFKAPGANRYQMTMTREDGEWRVAIASPAILVPEL